MASRQRRRSAAAADIDPVKWWTNQEAADTIIASAELVAWLADTPKQAMLNQYNALLTDLRRKTLSGSHACAQRTVTLLRNVIGRCRIPTVKSLVQRLSVMGHELLAAAPAELAIMNIVRRVLSLVREEAQLVATRSGGEVDDAEESGDPRRPTSRRFVPAEEDVLAINFKPVRANLLDAINELMDELANVNAAVADSVSEYIHSNDVILTHGADDTVLSFLLAAAGYVPDGAGSMKRKAKSKCRSFEVFVTEAAPSLDGHVMAKKLARHDIRVRASVCLLNYPGRLSPPPPSPPFRPARPP